MVKVKKLEWVKSISDLWVANVSLYSISLLNNRYVKNKYEPRYGKAVFNLCETLEEAKQACQDHYKAFILSQIENDHIIVEHDIAKPFDPTLLGFKLKDCVLIGYPKNSILYQNKEATAELLHFKDSGLWSLKTQHTNANVKCWLITRFASIKIPSHNFGVTLISQFLEVE